MGLLILLFTCALPIALALASPTSFIYYILFTGALPLGILAGDDVTTPFGVLNVISLRVLGVAISSVLIVFINLRRWLPFLSKVGTWLLFLSWCALSIFWCDDFIFGFRSLVKVSAPFLFGLAVLVVGTECLERKFFDYSVVLNLLILGTISLICKIVGIVGVKGALTVPTHGSPVFAAFLMLPIIVSAVNSITENNKFFWVSIFTFSFCLLVGSYARMPALAAFIALLYIISTRLHWSIKLPVLGLTSIVAYFSFFEFDYLKSRMFYSPKVIEASTLFLDPNLFFRNLDTSGRSELWKSILIGVHSNPFYGAGLGSTQEFLYALPPGNAKAAHCEYLRLYCDLGIVGIILFLIVGFYSIILFKSSLRSMRNSQDFESNKLLIPIGMLICFYIFCLTDNGLDYVNVIGVYIYAYVALAIRWAYKYNGETKIIFK
jgi:hypothetical protein